MLPQLRGAPVVALSAETGRGLDRLMPAVIKAHADWSTKVKTRDLNDWLKHGGASATRRRRSTAAASSPNTWPRPRPGPPTFVLFASRADKLPDSYRRYLVNSLRESFDLPGTPIRISVKSGKNPYAEEAPDAVTAFQNRRRAMRQANREK